MSSDREIKLRIQDTLLYHINRYALKLGIGINASNFDMSENDIQTRIIEKLFNNFAEDKTTIQFILSFSNQK
jgi:hypothetical protein